MRWPVDRLVKGGASWIERSTANVSPMKRLNRTRTNAIDRRRFHQDLQAIPGNGDPLITVWSHVSRYVADFAWLDKSALSH